MNLKVKRLFRNFLVRALLLSTLTASAYADVVVIVSARSAVTTLTEEQTANIFLVKVSTFPNGIQAIPVDQTEGSAAREEFYLKVTKKSTSQLSAYWAKAIFTGDSFPPTQLDGNLAVRRAVANNPYAIGYIDSSALDNNVRVVFQSHIHK